ncbi:ADP-ribosylation factor [Babesia ovata]|uniref:ADP-ribosylation factor n=1 Tax=Babesia ovata TaxID=189622 RepID=A0A2H6KI88_9APIC|nr:ADP-ribosylation factor [Babesia ovata]GBE62712.1 ADP-ribosylation factor [Babesia ovata]
MVSGAVLVALKREFAIGRISRSQMAGILERIRNFRNQESIHIFLCGLRGSGKTTLLYKSLLNDWEGICNEIEPTTLYHYEELRLRGRCFSIWDFSGDVKVTSLRHIEAK